jgi:hypothetical protein
MLAQLLADTPQWMEDGKNYAGFGASVVAAFGLVWKYAIKTYLEHREAERKKELEEAAALRKGEIDAAIFPLQAKLVHLADAMSGVNLQIKELTNEQQSLHREVRDHMQAEDAKRDGR